MRRAWLLLLVVGVSCSSESGRQYERNDLQLLTAFAAKEMCSCLFVMQRDETYCREWARQDPNLRTYDIDWNAKRVETQAVLYWGARAHYVSPRRGCVLE